MFRDDVVHATELKRNQRHWFDRARQTGGVTIVQGRRADLVLASRRVVAENMETAQRAQLIGQFLLEWLRAENGSLVDSVIFSWLADLDQTERQQFHADLIKVFAECVTRGDWTALDELLENWQATAEANRTQGLLDAWERRGHAEDYEPMKIPCAESI